MINKNIQENESYLYNNILKKYSKRGEWEFTKFLKENGETAPQSKMYPGTNYWVAYPDFEYFSDDKLTLLVELKCYSGYFGNKEYVVAMKKRHFKSYSTVTQREGVEVRVCFALIFDGEYSLYWETLENMNKMRSKNIQKYTQIEQDINTGNWHEVTEDYVFWYVTEFREDYWNLPVV